MDGLSSSFIVTAVDTVSSALYQWFRCFLSILFFTKNYGVSGLVLCFFGNRDIWRVQVQVLRSTSDIDTINFRKSVQEGCSIIAVAVRTCVRPWAARHQGLTTRPLEYYSSTDCYHGTLVGKPRPNTLGCPRVLYFQPRLINHRCLLRHKRVLSSGQIPLCRRCMDMDSWAQDVE